MIAETWQIFGCCFSIKSCSFSLFIKCSKVTEAFIRKGFYTIGALKTNRIIFPAGVGIGISKLAENIREEDKFFRPVTVKGRKYLVCRIECNLKDIDNAVVLITYPVGAFHNKKALIWNQHLSRYLCILTVNFKFAHL